jgi:hypothetical protein
VTPGVAGHPFDWHLHLVWLLVVVALIATYLWATSGSSTAPTSVRATGRQRFFFVSGAVLLGLAVAVAIVTGVAVGTLTTGAVSWAAGSSVAQAVLEVVVLASGFVLWAPVLHELPGAPKLSALGRGAYLIVQSIVPSFLSIVWIFARHPLYAPFAHSGKVDDLSPLLDQELSGFVAKLGTIFVLWTVAFVVMTRGESAAAAGRDAEPLLWSDVEREIERADRDDRRERRHGWRDFLPPSQDQT